MARDESAMLCDGSAMRSGGPRIGRRLSRAFRWPDLRMPSDSLQI